MMENSKMTLDQKMLKIQAMNLSVYKSGDNDFNNSKFAPLNNVLDVLLPVLTSFNLLLHQSNVSIEDRVGVKTRIIDTDSKEAKESTMTLPVEREKGKSLAQTAGSNISYCRRYSLISEFNLKAVDNDGVGQPPQHPQQQQAATKNVMDVKQKEVYNIMNKMGLRDPDASNYASLQISKGLHIDALISHLTDFNNGGYRWDVTSKQFLQK